MCAFRSLVSNSEGLRKDPHNGASDNRLEEAPADTEVVLSFYSLQMKTIHVMAKLWTLPLHAA